MNNTITTTIDTVLESFNAFNKAYDNLKAERAKIDAKLAELDERMKLFVGGSSDRAIKVPKKYHRKDQSETAVELAQRLIKENLGKQFFGKELRPMMVAAGRKASSFGTTINEMKNRGIIKSIGFGEYELIG